MSYWFHSLATGEKIIASSVQAISKLAQKEADRFGQAVQVHTGEGRKSHRKVSMARNPAKKRGGSSGGLVTYNAGKKAKRDGYSQRDNPMSSPLERAMWLKGFKAGK